VAAVSELREVHGEAVDFTIVSPEDTARRAHELERYALTARKHGLVALDAAGEPVMTIAGHQFGKAEIELALAQAAPTR
jgi:hypothetical protein